MTDLPGDLTVGEYIHQLEQNVTALEDRNAKLLETLQLSRDSLVELRATAIALSKDNAALERDLYTAAWYGSVHDVGVRFPPQSEEAR